MLTLIANSLAFIGLRRVKRPNIGGELTDQLLVDPFNLDFCVLLNSHGQPFRDWVKQRVGKSETKIERLAFNSGAKTDTLNLKLFNKAVGDSIDHV